MPTPARQLVDVQYRRNLAEFREWEEEKRKDQEQAVAALKRREKKAFKVSPWVGRVAGIVVFCAVFWVITYLVFSQERILSWPAR